MLPQTSKPPHRLPPQICQNLSTRQFKPRTPPAKPRETTPRPLPPHVTPNRPARQPLSRLQDERDEPPFHRPQVPLVVEFCRFSALMERINPSTVYCTHADTKPALPWANPTRQPAPPRRQHLTNRPSCHCESKPDHPLTRPAHPRCRILSAIFLLCCRKN